MHWGDVEQMNWDQRMVYDATGRQLFLAYPNPEPVDACSSFPIDGTKANPSSYGYDVSRLSDRFFDVVRTTDQPLYNDCDESQLSAVARLVIIKAENMSERCYDQVSQWASDLLPRDHTLPSDYYNTKKLIRDLDLPVEKIHAWKNGCMLYWKDNIKLEYCKFCGETEESSMCRPFNAEVWRHFDQSYPDFTVEPHNVRLALCTDGFAPHRQYGCTYSCWPVILTPYNLPHEMCMKPEYMCLTMVIPGPSNPKRRIDVYLDH
ncbi:UNVERIFIED_CONTAM: hypothetical protein Sradi_3202600 [Sesamum radiatum]|uniref:Uncharacterized protein n=1 Tax=Sesamum radiatum TaxID=300843 RepID=A0AAW2RHK6_SESRA